MQNLNYTETLDYLYGRLPMFSRVGARALKPGLDNTIRLCAALGNPQERFKSVHVAGTNGKGSTSHMLAAIMQQSGYKTGLYTSPHLVDFRERIRIDGVPVGEEFVVQFVADHRHLIEEIEPSFFEITVAMAFEVFAKEGVDIAIIETGLGGRLDSTNIITPELSIITNISLDHTDLLGDTRELIAVEKAGIIKHGIPVVIGERDIETRGVFEEMAAANSAPLHYAEDVWEAKSALQEGGMQTFAVKELASGNTKTISIDLPGEYQSQNLQSVLAACSVLNGQGWNITEQSLADALQHVVPMTGLHGRYERLGSSPLIIADVAHNAAGLKAVLAQWEQEPVARKHVILGFVSDKDVAAALRLFPKDNIYYCTAAKIPRALPAEELATMARVEGLDVVLCDSVADAVNKALESAGDEDGVLITGSFFIVGEGMEELRISDLGFRISDSGLRK